MTTPMTEHLAHIELLEEFGSYTEKRVGYFELNHRNLIDAGIAKEREWLRSKVSAFDIDSEGRAVIRMPLRYWPSQALKGEAQ